MQMLAVDDIAFEVKAASDGAALASMMGDNALPWVFACGAFIGGLNEIKSLSDSYELKNLITCDFTAPSTIPDVGLPVAKVESVQPRFAPFSGLLESPPSFREPDAANTYAPNAANTYAPIAMDMLSLQYQQPAYLSSGAPQYQQQAFLGRAVHVLPQVDVGYEWNAQPIYTESPYDLGTYSLPQYSDYASTYSGYAPPAFSEPIYSGYAPPAFVDGPSSIYR